MRIQILTSMVAVVVTMIGAKSCCIPKPQPDILPVITCRGLAFLVGIREGPCSEHLEGRGDIKQDRHRHLLDRYLADSEALILHRV